MRSHPPLAEAVLAAAALAFAGVAATPGAAGAAERLAVMGLRARPPGAVAATTVQAFDLMLWQALAGAEGVAPTSELQVGVAMGTGSAAALAGCQDDGCMAQIGAAAGLDRLVYCVAARRDDGFDLHVRSLGLSPLQVLGERTVSCAPCGEADVLNLLGQAGVVGVATGGRTASARAVASLAPASGAAGSVRVESEPPGAAVLLDGAALGTTPLQIPAIAPGVYALLLDLAGHEEELAEVEVRAGREARVQVRLRAMAQLRIAAAGDGAVATVYVDGRPRGLSPVEVGALSAGEHEVVVIAPGRREARLLVPLLPAEVADLIVELLAADARAGAAPPTGLLIESAPAHAAVLVGGRVQGWTPLRIDGVQPGPHRIEVVAPWHDPASVEVGVVSGAVVRRLVPLEPLPFTHPPEAPRQGWAGASEGGVRQGPWLRHGEAGRRIEEVSYQRGIPHGRYAAWHDAPGSPLRAAGAFRRGEPHGPWLAWSTDGGVEAAGWYEGGRLEAGAPVAGAESAGAGVDAPACPEGATLVSGANVQADGSALDGPVRTLRRWCERADGAPHGPRHDRSFDGKFWCATDYDDGLAHGRSICWNDDGAKRSERRLVRGRVQK